MSITTERISQIQLALVPSTDQDRSLAFYESLGFERRNDMPWGDGFRWVEVYPPDGTTGLALVPRGPGVRTGVQTGIILNTRDIDAAHAEMKSAGVDVDAQGARVGAPAAIRIGAVELVGPVPPMFWSRDPDGNALLLVEGGLSKWHQGRRARISSVNRSITGYNTGHVRAGPLSRTWYDHDSDRTPRGKQ